MHNELSNFFDAYVESWPKGPAAISEFYAEPCLSARGGGLKAHLLRADLASLFDAVDKQYRARGYAGGERRSFDYRPLGENTALVTIRWAYTNSSGQPIWETTFSYNVIKQPGGWKIYVQTMHD